MTRFRLGGRNDKYMLIDTHAHVNFKDFENDRKEVIQRSLVNGIWMINVGSQFSTSQRAVKMSEEYEEGVYAAVGLHPVHLSSHPFHDQVDNQEDVEFTPRSENFEKEKYQELAKNEKVVAIGEVGLDYFHNKDNKEIQQKVFAEQIDLACEMDLPIIIHCREAHEDNIQTLREKKKEYGEKMRGVMHCFSGGIEEAQIYVEELGLHLGFNGIITFARDYDEVLRQIDPNKILVETDCPYLTPVPFRGKRNEPLYVEYAAHKIAEIKGTSLGEVAKTTTKNAKKLFALK